MNLARSKREERLRRNWDGAAPTFDGKMSAVERRFFRDTRPWLASQAVGDTLEVAIGTGSNLPHYPAGVRLSGMDWSRAMIDLARSRAASLGLAADLRQGDARALDFADSSFDTVISTFSMCGIPEHERALAEVARVLRPGGLLLLADHVASSAWPVRGLQAVVEVVSVPMMGEHWRRRPLPLVKGLGFTIERHDRFLLGIIERFAARKPGHHTTETSPLAEAKS